MLLATVLTSPGNREQKSIGTFEHTAILTAHAFILLKGLTYI